MLTESGRPTATYDPLYAPDPAPLSRRWDFVTATEYAADLKVSCAFGPQSLKNVLGDYLAQRNMTQLRIAETEKYAHVTFFFSGGREEPYAGETR